MFKKLIDSMKAKKEAEQQAKAAALLQVQQAQEEKARQLRLLYAADNYLRAASGVIHRMGDSDDFKRWEKAERDYAEAGYRTISLDLLQKTNAQPHALADYICIKRDAGEEPTFHAALYKQYYWNSVSAAIALRELRKASGTDANASKFGSTEALVEMLQKVKGQKELQ